MGEDEEVGELRMGKMKKMGEGRKTCMARMGEEGREGLLRITAFCGVTTIK
jgi:hypothetical protein